MNHEPTPRQATIALVLALAVVAAAHLGVVGVGLVWDDHHLLGPDGLAQRATSWTQLFTSRFFDVKGRELSAVSYYRPLTLLTLRAFGSSLPWQHAVNLLVHLGVCALVFAGARRAGARPEAAALAAALFGTVPRLTESVDMIAGRTDLLASLGVLGALLVHTSEPAAHGRRWAAAALLLAALLCKEVALAGFIALAALEWARGPRRLRPLALNLLPATTALAVLFAMRWAAHVPAAPAPLASLPLRALFALQALGTYTIMLLSLWHPQLVIGTVGWVDPVRIALGGLAALALLAAIGALLAGRVPARQTAWLALAVSALLPVLHLIPLSIRAMAADRFLYLPLAAAAIALAPLLPRPGSPRARPVFVALSAAVVLFASLTGLRTDVFRDELSLWEREAAHANPGNGEPAFELATRVAWRGDDPRALALYAESLRRERTLARRFPVWHPPDTLLADYGLVLSSAGRSDEAVRVLDALCAARPDVAIYQLYRGGALSRALRFAEADAALAHALALYPDYTLAQQARAQNARAAALWKTLPPEKPDEPAPLRARRAQVYQWVGLLDRAAALWAEVARAPDAGPPELDAARRALAQQRRALGDTKTTRALAAALAERERRG